MLCMLSQMCRQSKILGRGQLCAVASILLCVVASCQQGKIGQRAFVLGQVVSRQNMTMNYEGLKETTLIEFGFGELCGEES